MDIRASRIALPFLTVLGATVVFTDSAHAAVNDEQIRCAAAQLLELTEGSLGALVMVVAGIGTVIASAFGAYRAAVSLLAVAIGAFTLRSFVEIFFEDVGQYSDARCKVSRHSGSGDAAPGGASIGGALQDLVNGDVNGAINQGIGAGAPLILEGAQDLIMGPPAPPASDPSESTGPLE